MEILTFLVILTGITLLHYNTPSFYCTILSFSYYKSKKTNNLHHINKGHNNETINKLTLFCSAVNSGM